MAYSDKVIDHYENPRNVGAMDKGDPSVGTGCSGLAYKLEYADDPLPEDVVFESHGVRVLVDPRSLSYIDGTELDFAREGLNEGFRFNNPNVKSECGCGESFKV